MITDAAPWKDVPPEERRAAEREAFARLLEFIDPAQHHLMRMYVMGEGLPSGTNVGAAGACDPEVARLLGVIASVRAVDKPIVIPPTEDGTVQQG